MGIPDAWDTGVMVAVPSCTGVEVSVGSLRPGSGAFPVVLHPGDGVAEMSRTAGSSSMRLSRG